MRVVDRFAGSGTGRPAIGARPQFALVRRLRKSGLSAVDRLQQPRIRRTGEQLPKAEGAVLGGLAQQRRVVIASQPSGLDVRSSLH
jgi:hypothetical protein